MEPTELEQTEMIRESGLVIDGYFGETCEITIRAYSLLHLEKGLFQLLSDTRMMLNNPYSENSSETVREVLARRG